MLELVTRVCGSLEPPGSIEPTGISSKITKMLELVTRVCGSLEPPGSIEPTGISSKC